MKRLLLVAGILFFSTSGQVFSWAANMPNKPCGAAPGPGYCVCMVVYRYPQRIPIPGTGVCFAGSSEGYTGCLHNKDCPYSVADGGVLILLPSAFPEFNIGPLVPVSFWGPVF